MNRRGFLRLLGTAAAAVALDPERVLWEPGKVSHHLAPAEGWRPLSLHEQYLKGTISRESGFEWFADPDPDFLASARRRFDEAKAAEALTLEKMKADLAFLKGDQWKPSIRVVQQFDIASERKVTRFDVLYGVGLLRLEDANRLCVIKDIKA